MYSSNYRKNDSTITQAVVCAIVFVAFSLLWTGRFHADLLALRTIVLTGSSYSVWSVAGVLTAVLLLFSLFVGSMTGLRGRFYALNYLPALLILAMLTDVNDSGDVSVLPFSWWWTAPIALAVWLAVVFLAHQFPASSGTSRRSVKVRNLWVNLLLMVVMTFVTVSLSNTNAVLRYRAQVEHALMEGRVADALEVGDESLETDLPLTQLRAYALTVKQELGDGLFEYPIVGSSSELFSAKQVHTMAFPADSLLRHQQDADVQLCGFLIDRDVDAFARQISRSRRKVDESLPRYYREALILYTHMRSAPVVVYHDSVLDADYEDFQQLEKQYADFAERKVRVEEKYANSYWYYYHYLR